MKKISKRIESLLFEAYRRNDMADSYEKAKPMNKRWLGLGTEAAYRPAIKAGLMRFFDRRTPPPRCMGWLVLTDDGIKVYESLEEGFSEVMEDIKQNTNYSKSYTANYILMGGLSRR